MSNNDDIFSQIDSLSGQISVSPREADLYFRRGKLYWKSGNKAKAMTDFNSAIEIDPTSPAKEYVEIARDIMDFYNTDLYNP